MRRVWHLHKISRDLPFVYIMVHFKHNKNYTPSRLAVGKPSDVDQCEMKTELFLFHHLTRCCGKSHYREREEKSTGMMDQREISVNEGGKCLQNVLSALICWKRIVIIFSHVPPKDLTKTKTEKIQCFDDKKRNLFIKTLMLKTNLGKQT